MTPDSKRNTLAELFITHLLLGPQTVAAPPPQENAQTTPSHLPANQVDDTSHSEVSQT